MLEDFSDAPERKRRRTRRPMGTGKRILVSLLALVLLIIIGIGAYVWFLSSKVDRNLDREDLLGTQSEDYDPNRDSSGNKLVTDAGTNYLLLGSDARPGETFSRADVIQLVHVDEDNENIWLIHFPRDLYVPIDGHGKDKINAAYAYGKAPLLVRTIQDLVGVKIDHVAKTDFEGFVALTNALGGVTVNNPQGGDDFPKGRIELDGDEALEFVRERKSLQEGDISRGERQQAWLKGIMNETLTPGVLLNPAKLTDVIDAGTKHTTVDNQLTTSKIRSQAIALRGVRGDDIHFVTAPFAGYGTTSGGASIDVLDERGMERLGEALQRDDMDSFVE